MPQEADEERTVHGVAVQSLKNELEIAVRLLRGVREARETMALEDQVIDSARNAFRHAVEALDRVPHISYEDMLVVQQLMDEFRAALLALDS